MAALLTAEPKAANPGTFAVSTSALTKRYRDTLAVDSLTLDISPGEVFGLLGPNGAGKTTTILLLLGMTEPTSGSVRVLGADPTRDPLLVKSRVGYLPDEVGFYDNLSARANLRYTAALNRLPRRVADERIDELLVDVGLSADAERKVGTFSRGMRQRLGVADALIKRPEMLILDEPTVNIDPEGVRELLLLVERLRTDHGVTVLLSSHLLHQVQQVCDRIGIFVAGRLAACGTIDELAARIDGRWEFTVGLDEVAEPVRLLGAVPGVRTVEKADRLWTVRADGDVRADLGRAVHEAGGVLTHLARRTADLDAIYHRYFGAQENGDDDR